jgi:hypothetical protein
MIQQVNLYQDILRQEQHKSGINLYWIGLTAIALLLIGFSVYLLWNLNNTEVLVQSTTKKLEAEQAKVNFISSKIPNQEIDTQLAADVAQWQTMLDEIAQAMRLLSNKVTDQSPGFSNYFQALSNQAIPDVWLSALYLNRQQQIINIEGSTFKPEKIPYFLQQLQKEPVFNGHSFAKLMVQQSKETPSQMDFKLNTTLEATDKTNHAQ